MKLQQDNKLITGLIPKGKGAATVAALKEKLNIDSANVSGGRSDLFDRSDRAIESEALTVVVSTEQADEVFSFLYDELNIGRAHNGILFQTPLKSSTP
ncbi:MAG: hypothetical protein HOM84_05335 [Thiotrichales bacterium]|jgi:hypothetical protein|nr:hypothetical protein [Thiotrichales bacterium]MBT3613380.1 hypothetical protein [Thiotrichales bacterium]MBT4260944.1 hypothetical protein [Thiotrichales bacterium]MBT4574249.1 hypothetical protein [Thiotrichales bacterium]MBT4971953.1 hypothetical protein [Thiotrichales bacterium]